MKLFGLFMIVALLVTSPNAIANVGAREQTIKRGDVAYTVIPFSRLSFKYKPPMDVELPDGNILKASKTPMAIPDNIKALDAQKIAITGYVIPLEVEGNTVKRFLFSDMLATCLFCQMLGFDQWVYVEVVDPKGFILKDAQFEEPVTIYGDFEAAEKFEEGRLVSLYRLKAKGLESERKKFLGIL